MQRIGVFTLVLEMFLFLTGCTGPVQSIELSTQQPGPFGILRLPSEFESNRISFRQTISQTDETVVAQMDGEGCLRHFWLTVGGIRTSPENGLYLTLRIYFDGSDRPSVEMPLAPFFGIHHGHETKEINSPYIQVTNRSGFNSYFPMPFKNGMRITLQNDGPEEIGIWFQADYHEYASGTLSEASRFNAVFRRVNLNEAYGEPHHLAHGVGRGAIVGMTMGMRVFDRTDHWFHCGGDLVLLNGRTLRARVLSGIGGEDFFGTAWGQDVFSNRSVGTPYYDVHEEPADGEPHIVFAAYRLFDRDPVRFSDSFSYDFGTLANDVSTVLYWYQEGEALEVSTLPSARDRLAPTAVSDGKYDVPLKKGLSWDLCGPFSCANRQEFDRQEFPEESIQLDQTASADFGQYATAVESGLGKPTVTRWHTGAESVFNFVDVTPYFRSRMRANMGFPTDVSAYATTTIESGRPQSVKVRIGHDDWLKLWVNGEVVYEGEQLSRFGVKEINIDLEQGTNQVLAKVANQDNSNFRAWVFLFDLLEE